MRSQFMQFDFIVLCTLCILNRSPVSGNARRCPVKCDAFIVTHFPLSLSHSPTQFIRRTMVVDGCLLFDFPVDVLHPFFVVAHQYFIRATESIYVVDKTSK